MLESTIIGMYKDKTQGFRVELQVSVSITSVLHLFTSDRMGCQVLQFMSVRLRQFTLVGRDVELDNFSSDPATHNTTATQK